MYSTLTREELIDELKKRDETIETLIQDKERMDRFKTLLVRAIIHHYNNDYGEVDKDYRKQFHVISDE